MTDPIAQKILNVSSTGTFTIVIEQISQNEAANSSVVNVRASIKNVSGDTVSHTNSTISCWINGDQSFTGPGFTYDLSAGQAHEIISHNFTVVHDVTGNKTVSFSASYGATGNAKFGGNSNETVSTTLKLARIAKRPGQPGPIVISDHLTTSVTLSWDPATDDGGTSIQSYLLRRWNGATATGSYVDNSADDTSRTVTGLTAGATYTFQVYTFNGATDNNGYSNGRTATTILMRAGPYIRTGGAWKLTAPYIRDNGTWKAVVSYVRKNGIWKTMG